jgi:hypothetical protein
MMVVIDSFRWQGLLYSIKQINAYKTFIRISIPTLTEKALTAQSFHWAVERAF